MANTAAVARHYSIEDIIGRIKSGLTKTGKSVSTVTVDELSLADEFHIGGRKATDHFFPQLGFNKGERILDVGCGIGGGARCAAEKYGVEVVGVDLTEAYIETGQELNNWVGIADKVHLETGDATSLRFEDESFDKAFTMHVCMNIEDKKAVFDEVYRVLKHGGVFGVYDVMKYGDGECEYPLPWAATETTSFLESSESYVESLKRSGFDIEIVSDRHQFAVDFFEAVKAKMAGAGGPPPLGIHVLMGDNAPQKVRNLTANLVNRLVAPFEIIARKR